MQMRMIDGELALPDETPPDGWRELRVAAPEGMVTIRRAPGRIVLGTFGPTSCTRPIHARRGRPPCGRSAACTDQDWPEGSGSRT